MARKFEATGKAVVYTRDGVEIVDAEVRRSFNVHCDTCSYKLKNFQKPHILVGGGRANCADR